MTTNAFLFSWDQLGIEAIIPITQYEEHDKKATWDILNGREPVRNPLTSIIQQLLLRARMNPQRHYEIYSIDCSDASMTEEVWRTMWQDDPQGCANLIRERGQKLFSDREVIDRRVIV